MNKYFIYFLFLILTSCSTLWSKKHYSDLSNQIGPLEKDYRDQLESLSEAYFNNHSVRRVFLSRRSKEYLNLVYEKIAKNNELLITNDDGEFKVFIIKDRAPFIFSLPGGQIYLTTGLFVKYFKNESLFVAALAYEIIKSSRSIYKKSFIIPMGVISTNRLMSLTTLSLEHKVELDKWTYFALKRAGYEQSAVLNWIQLQNKNSIDLSTLNSNKRILVEEELFFKKFLASHELEESQGQYLSSNDFYVLLNEVKRKAYEARNI